MTEPTASSDDNQSPRAAGSRFGIVIPVYRADPDRLGEYIERLDDELAPARIHVEADCPSEAVLQRLASTTATVNVADRRRGKGAAITAGFDELDTDILAFVDADGSTPTSSLEAVIKPVIEGSAALAVGSRRHPEATVTTHQSRVRRRLGDVLVAIARLILPVELYDYQCGAKAIDRSTWETVRGELTSRGFAWDIELVCLVDGVGAPIREIPILWEDRPGSTVPVVRSGIGFGRALFRGWHRAGLVNGSPLHRSIDRALPTTVPIVESPQCYGEERDR